MTTTPTTEAERAQQLVAALWDNPSVRAKAKELFPDITVPEDHVNPLVEPLRAQLDETKSELEKMRAEAAEERKAREEAKMERSFHQRIEEARNKFPSLTDDGYNRALDRMKETGNYGDPEAAMAWVARQETPANSPTKADWLPKKLDLFGHHNERQEESFRLLHRDPDAYMDNELAKFVANPEAYTNETLGL